MSYNWSNAFPPPFALKLETWCESLILSLWLHSSPVSRRLALWLWWRHEPLASRLKFQFYSNTTVTTPRSELKTRGGGDDSAMIWLSMCSLMKKNSILNILNIGIYSQLNTLFYEKEKEAEIQFLLFHRERNRPDVPLTIPFFSSTETLYLSYITAGASDTAEPFWWTEGDVSKPFVPDCLSRGKKKLYLIHIGCAAFANTNAIFVFEPWQEWLWDTLLMSGLKMLAVGPHLQ